METYADIDEDEDTDADADTNADTQTRCRKTATRCPAPHGKNDANYTLFRHRHSPHLPAKY